MQISSWIGGSRSEAGPRDYRGRRDRARLRQTQSNRETVQGSQMEDRRSFETSRDQCAAPQVYRSTFSIRLARLDTGGNLKSLRWTLSNDLDSVVVNSISAGGSRENVPQE
jgi:hypothetical protein